MKARLSAGVVHAANQVKDRSGAGDIGPIAEPSDALTNHGMQRSGGGVVSGKINVNSRRPLIPDVICLDPLVKPLTHKQFDKLARELFGAVLSPHGFSCELSRHCTFTRQIGDAIIHVIMPDPGTRCAWYDIHVFPTSPRLHDDFAERFPDSLGNTLDVWGQTQRNRRYRNGSTTVQLQIRIEHEKQVPENRGSLLVNTAIPFLDMIQTYDDMLPRLRGPFARFNGK